MRGEYHVENITAYDAPKNQGNNGEDIMEVDEVKAEVSVPPSEDQPPERQTQENAANDKSKVPKIVTFEAKEDGKESLDIDALYPIFWNLQSSFSAPTRLFDAENFASFKSGLQSTIETFQRTKSDIDSRNVQRPSESDAKKGIKRKRGSDGNEVANNFNPKYLTSRDLFELEVRVNVS